MTSLQLVGLIASAWLAQVAVGVGAAFWRRRGQAPARPGDALPAEGAAGAGAWAGVRDFRIASRVFEDAARSQCSLLLEPVDGRPLPAFLPGQYLTLQLHLPSPGTDPQRRHATVTRCYSLSDRPDPRTFRITVKRVPAATGGPDRAPGLASTWLVDRSAVGDIVQVRAPSGRFVIDATSQRPVVLVAGGIGITPLMSMVRWMLVEQPLRDIHLYCGVRCGLDHPFKALLDEWALSKPTLRVHVAYSQPGLNDLVGRDFQHPGRVDVDLLRRTLPHGSFQFYLCGPSPMMADLVAGLRGWGVPAGDIHHEAFGPASVIATPRDGPLPDVADSLSSVDVRFNRSQRTLEWDGHAANLLDFAEDHGVAMESGCRSGSCGSCAVKLVSGRVQYAQPPDFDVPSGYCLPCVGTPTMALVLEA